jgi:hypothetical protein
MLRNLYGMSAVPYFMTKNILFFGIIHCFCNVSNDSNDNRKSVDDIH